MGKRKRYGVHIKLIGFTESQTLRNEIQQAVAAVPTVLLAHDDVFVQFYDGAKRKERNFHILSLAHSTNPSGIHDILDAVKDALKKTYFVH